jgi:hypothetical protein
MKVQKVLVSVERVGWARAEEPVVVGQMVRDAATGSVWRVTRVETAPLIQLDGEPDFEPAVTS